MSWFKTLLMVGIIIEVHVIIFHESVDQTFAAVMVSVGAALIAWALPVEED